MAASTDPARPRPAAATTTTGTTRRPATGSKPATAKTAATDKPASQPETGARKVGTAPSPTGTAGVTGARDGITRETPQGKQAARPAYATAAPGGKADAAGHDHAAAASAKAPAAKPDAAAAPAKAPAAKPAAAAHDHAGAAAAKAAGGAAQPTGRAGMGATPGHEGHGHDSIIYGIGDNPPNADAFIKGSLGGSAGADFKLAAGNGFKNKDGRNPNGDDQNQNNLTEADANRPAYGIPKAVAGTGKQPNYVQDIQVGIGIGGLEKTRPEVLQELIAAQNAGKGSVWNGVAYLTGLNDQHDGSVSAQLEAQRNQIMNTAIGNSGRTLAQWAEEPKDSRGTDWARTNHAMTGIKAYLDLEAGGVPSDVANKLANNDDMISGAGRIDQIAPGRASNNQQNTFTGMNAAERKEWAKAAKSANELGRPDILRTLMDSHTMGSHMLTQYGNDGAASKINGNLGLDPNLPADQRKAILTQYFLDNPTDPKKNDGGGNGGGGNGGGAARAAGGGGGGAAKATGGGGGGGGGAAGAAGHDHAAMVAAGGGGGAAASAGGAGHDHAAMVAAGGAGGAAGAAGHDHAAMVAAGGGAAGAVRAVGAAAGLGAAPAAPVAVSSDPASIAQALTGSIAATTPGAIAGGGIAATIVPGVATAQADPALLSALQAALQQLEASSPEVFQQLLGLQAQGIDPLLAAGLVMALFDDPTAAAQVPAPDVTAAVEALTAAGIGRAGEDPRIPLPAPGALAAAPAPMAMAPMADAAAGAATAVGAGAGAPAPAPAPAPATAAAKPAGDGHAAHAH